jgi:chemotaxis protein MotB
LSLYRSLSIIDLCIAQGIAAERFVATGYSEYRPLYPNDSAEHKAANRRVEIVIRHRETESRKLENVSGMKEESPEGES